MTDEMFIVHINNNDNCVPTLNICKINIYPQQKLIKVTLPGRLCGDFEIEGSSVAAMLNFLSKNPSLCNITDVKTMLEMSVIQTKFPFYIWRYDPKTTESEIVSDAFDNKAEAEKEMERLKSIDKDALFSVQEYTD